MRLGIIFALSPLLFAQDSGTVEGHVRNSVTGVGIGGVAVQLRSGRAVAYSATTDDSGAFRIFGLKDGEYRVSFTKDGFSAPQADSPAPRVRVLGNDAVRLNAELIPPSSVRGRVVDADGNPASKIRVEMIPGFAITDDQGNFVIENLAPGTYTLLVRPQPNPHVQDGQRIESVPTYFPSTVDSDQAEQIEVRAGADLSGYDIRIRTVPVHRIRGMVLDSAGNPVRIAGVFITKPVGRLLTIVLGEYTLSRSQARVEKTINAGNDGVFEFSSVPAGDWRVWSKSSLGYDYVRHRDTIVNGSVSARVSAGDIDGLEIRLGPPFVPFVSADWGDSQPFNANVLIPPFVLLPLDGQPPDADRTTLYPGRYSIVPNLGLTPGFYPAAVLLGTRDVMGQQVELTSNSPPIKVVYKSDGGTVRGTAGKGAMIVLMPQRPDDVNSGLSVRCQPDGTFVVNDVPPGDYYAAAFVTIPSPAFLNASMPGAARVKVEAKAVVTLDLSVIR